MNYREWWAARRLLYEEKFGVHLRAAEREHEATEARIGDDYARTVARLKQQQLDLLET